jgi:hypothetical protein
MWQPIGRKRLKFKKRIMHELLAFERILQIQKFWCYAAKNLKVEYYIKGKQF